VVPPFDAGAVKAMLALPLPAVPAPMVGAVGTVLVDPAPDRVLELSPPPQPAAIMAAAIANAAVLNF
jgi:hypothetical protein